MKNLKTFSFWESHSGSDLRLPRTIKRSVWQVPAAKTVSIKPFDNICYWNTLVPIFSLSLSISIKSFDNILQWNKSNPLQISSTATLFNPFSHRVYLSDVRDLDLWVPKGKSIIKNPAYGWPAKTYFVWYDWITKIDDARVMSRMIESQRWIMSKLLQQQINQSNIKYDWIKITDIAGNSQIFWSHFRFLWPKYSYMFQLLQSFKLIVSPCKTTTWTRH